MANVGRVFCVALPFMLTLASLIAILVAGLAGVTDKSLYIFMVNTTDFSVSASSITNLLNQRSLDERDAWVDTTSITPTIESRGTSEADAKSAAANAVSETNITGDNLGLSDVYYINLWNYCQTSATGGGKDCKKPKYNWASNATRSFENELDSVASSNGQNVTLPSDVKSAMSTLGTVTRWTEIVFLIAYGALGVELFLGIFANCSRAFSCCTFIIAAFAAVAVCAAAALATATAAVVIGVVDEHAKTYGVKGSINTHFLAAVWIGAAFSIGSAVFWVFTICCCAPNHNGSSRGTKTRGFGRKKGIVEPEKLSMSGAYAPLPETTQTSYGGSGAYPGNGAYAGHGDYGVNGDYGAPGAYAAGANGYDQGVAGNTRNAKNVAYEPYTHRA